uniref:Uncharacterized protein n=1 Tax=Graphocephala atropunctata TaxID=36148 RepID=A0A1B6KBA6_9HEMI
MTSQSRQADALSAELELLVQEESLIRKTLQYVRMAKQRNRIEGIEILSKIKELQRSKLNSSLIEKKKENHAKQNISAENILENNSVPQQALQFHEPTDTNQIKLNLDVTNQNYFQEEESEESD